jgi:hypothetical protein
MLDLDRRTQTILTKYFEKIAKFTDNAPTALETMQVSDKYPKIYNTHFINYKEASVGVGKRMHGH